MSDYSFLQKSIDINSETELTEKHEKLINYCKKNKISLIDIQNSDPENTFEQNFIESSYFKDALQQEINHSNNWLIDFAAIKDEWDKEKIEYIFHKSTGKFPYLSDNLDVLVKSSNFKKAGDILCKMGYVCLRNIQEAHKEFYRKFDSNRERVPIHLHERVCWSVPFENNELLWKNRRQLTDIIYCPGYEDALLVTSAHCFLEDHVVKIFDLLSIEKCITSKDIDWDYVYSVSREMYWEDSLHTAFIIFDHLYRNLFDKPLIPQAILQQSKDKIKNKNWISTKLEKDILLRGIKFPFKIPHLWTRRHSALRELRDPAFGSKIKRIYQVFSSLFDRFIHLKLKIKNHPNYFIVFSGIDGSGKTSHIEALQNAFLTCEIKSKKIWSRAGSTPLIQLLLKISRIFYLKKRTENQIKQSPKNNLPKKSFSIFCWRQFNIFDLIIYYIFKIRIPLFFGKIVIADRYILDSIIDLESFGRNNVFNRISYKLLNFFSPKPDKAIYLKISPPEAMRRDQNNNINEDIVTEHLYYKNNISSFGYIQFDNSVPFGQVSRDIIFEILTEYFKKYPEKYSNYATKSFRYK